MVRNAPLPTPEDADTNHPIQPYAASKKSAEALSYSYHYLYGTDVTVFRFFNCVRARKPTGHGRVPFHPMDL